MAESILRRYNFRLYPNRIQSAEMDTMRRMHCTLYNAALQQRIDAYRLAGVSLTFFTQSKDITTIRADDPAYAAISSDSLRATLKRLDLAYQAFYRRAKAGAGKESGFPKYRRSDDYPGFKHRSGDGWKLSLAPRARKGTMYLKGVTGQIALRGKFPGPPISVRTCDVKLHGGIWWASIAVELPARMRAEQQHSGEVTFDLVDHFARVRRVDGGHAAGPEDTVYAAADGRIFPVFEGVTHQTESSDEHQGSVGNCTCSRAELAAESSDEHQGSVGTPVAGHRSGWAESSDESQGSVGPDSPRPSGTSAGSSDEHQGSVGHHRYSSTKDRAESSDESQGSVGRVCRNIARAGSSDEHQGSVGAGRTDVAITRAGSSDEHQVSVGTSKYTWRPSSAGSSDESQGSVGATSSSLKRAMAGSSDERQGSVGNRALSSRRHQTESSDEHQGSVGAICSAILRSEAEASDEHQGSVGSHKVGDTRYRAEASDEQQGSVGVRGRTDVAITRAGLSDEHQGSVGTSKYTWRPPEAGSSDEQQGSVGHAARGGTAARAGSSDEHQGSVGSPVGRSHRRKADSPDESQGSVGDTPSSTPEGQAGSSGERQGSVGAQATPSAPPEAEASDEHQESVGRGSPRPSGTSAGSSGETQETVGVQVQVAGASSPTGSPPKTKKTVGAARSVKDLQRGMAKCKRGSRRYRYRRRIKAKREARVARQRRESLHVWSTTLVRRYASLVIIKPPLVEATQSGAGTEREPGAAVGLKAEVNRHVLDQAPGLAISMLEYKLAERGGTAKIIETRAAPVLAGNLVVAATKANRRLKRTAARA